MYDTVIKVERILNGVKEPLFVIVIYILKATNAMSGDVIESCEPLTS